MVLKVLEGSPMRDLIENYFQRLKNTIDKIDRAEVETFINIVRDARDHGNTIFIMGNGGSACTASHFLCDIAKGVNYNKKKRFKVVCLNDNYPIMMAYANDVSYEEVFVEQLKNHFQKGDVVIGLSGSGNSKNVLKAIEYANHNGGITIGLTGYNGGKLKELAQCSVNANIDDMQISEDLHMVLVHLTMQVVEKEAK